MKIEGSASGDEAPKGGLSGLEAVRDLAPNQFTFLEALRLAALDTWKSTGAEGTWRWGEYPLTPLVAYRAAVDVQTRRHTCNCRAQEKPCKHVLALLVQYVEGRAAPSGDKAPHWVAKALNPSEAPAQRTVPSTHSEAFGITPKRRAEMARGLADLSLRLNDLMATGLADAAQQPDLWPELAARMTDAKLSGLATRLRRCHEDMALPDWPDKVLPQLASMHLLARAFAQYDNLPKAMQAEVAMQLGVSLKKEAVMALEGVADQWAVMAVQHSEQGDLRVRHVWMLGAQTGRYALLLDYVWVKAAFLTEYHTGQWMDTELAYYPVPWPMRAQPKSTPEPVAQPPVLPTLPDFGAVAARHAQALAATPWLSDTPALVADAALIYDGGRFQVLDAKGHCVPCACPDQDAWQLLASGGGQAAPTFGLWDGRRFLPLSVLG